MHPYLAVPATLMLVWRAWSRNSLTPAGIFVATVTAIVHALHPWSCFFALLVVFFLGGTTVTKASCSGLSHFATDKLTWIHYNQVKQDVKARLTLSSTGASGAEGPRTHIQVLANSIVASVLILLHYRQLLARGNVGNVGNTNQNCWLFGGDLLVVGIVRYSLFQYRSCESMLIRLL